VTAPAQAEVPLSGVRGADPLPPYVRLIHDVLIGDRSLFTRPDGLAAVWKVAGPLLTSPPKVAGYPAGSWGPEAARKLVARARWLWCCCTASGSTAGCGRRRPGWPSGSSS